jgi:hypothetical protein
VIDGGRIPGNNKLPAQEALQAASKTWVGSLRPPQPNRIGIQATCHWVSPGSAPSNVAHACRSSGATCCDVHMEVSGIGGAQDPVHLAATQALAQDERCRLRVGEFRKAIQGQGQGLEFTHTLQASTGPTGAPRIRMHWSGSMRGMFFR